MNWMLASYSVMREIMSCKKKHTLGKIFMSKTIMIMANGNKFNWFASVCVSICLSVSHQNINFTETETLSFLFTAVSPVTKNYQPIISAEITFVELMRQSCKITKIFKTANISLKTPKALQSTVQSIICVLSVLYMCLWKAL